MFGSINQIVSAEDTDGPVSDHHIHYSSHTIEDDGAASDHHIHYSSHTIEEDGAVSNHHIHYSSHTIEEDGGATVEEVSAVPPLEISINDSSQLTLSFRGQVYVFDAVTPDKALFFFFSFIITVSFKNELIYASSFLHCYDGAVSGSSSVVAVGRK